MTSLGAAWRQLRSDHIAGAFFVGAGLVVLALSRDLPVGRLAAPGAGMMPDVITILMILFGLILILQAGRSAPLSSIHWSELKHALSVIVITAGAVYLYERLGFILDMSLLIFVLLVAVERRQVLPALLFATSVSVSTYFLFTVLLKTPLEQGVLGSLL
jgi:hypothetical protein